MSSLMHIPKNGKLENKSGLTHNVWSNWIDDLFKYRKPPSLTVVMF